MHGKSRIKFNNVLEKSDRLLGLNVVVIINYKIRFIPGMSRTRLDIRNDPGIDKNDTTTKRVKAPACTGSNAYWSATTNGTCRTYAPNVFSERICIICPVRLKKVLLYAKMPIIKRDRYCGMCAGSICMNPRNPIHRSTGKPHDFRMRLVITPRTKI